MKIAATGTGLLLLAGCAHWFGPSDGLLYVIGSTPSSAPCELSLAPVGSPPDSRARVVSGEFREEFGVNHSPNGHFAQLKCGGRVAVSRTFQYGLDVRFGGELPIDGSEP